MRDREKGARIVLLGQGGHAIPKLQDCYGHKLERFEEFKEKYLGELEHNQTGEAFVEKVADVLEEEDRLLL